MRKLPVRIQVDVLRGFVVRGGRHDRSAGSGTEGEGNEMTTTEMFEQMKTELDDRVAQLRSAINEIQESCRCTTQTLHEEIEKMTKPAPAGGEKLYTAPEVIRLVQETISEEICGLDDGGMLVAYEVERGIIRKLVKEEDA